MQPKCTETLGARIKRLREKQTVTLISGATLTMRQEDLAITCGCEKGTISRIEGNRQKPSLELATALAKALNVTLDELVNGNQPQQP